MRIVSSLPAMLLAAAVAFAATGNRQVTSNPQSPTADTMISLAGHPITIEYNAPSARGRKVEGGLIPYDTWYRLGADAATTLSTDTDIMIGDLRVPKGVHTLFLYATANNGWKLIVNKETKQWGLSYHEDQDLGRVAMKLSKTDQLIDTFKLTLHKTGDRTGLLTVEWGNTKAEVPLRLA